MTRLYWVILGFTVFVTGFIDFYWVILGITVFITGFREVLLVFTRLYWVLLGFTGLYRVVLGLPGFTGSLLFFTGFHEVSLIFTVFFYWILLDYTGLYWVILNLTRFYCILLVYIRFSLFLLDFTGLEFDYDRLEWVQLGFTRHWPGLGHRPKTVLEVFAPSSTSYCASRPKSNATNRRKKQRKKKRPAYLLVGAQVGHGLLLGLTFALVAMVLEPDLDLRRRQVDETGQVFAFRRRQVFLLLEAPLQFVHLIHRRRRR